MTTTGTTQARDAWNAMREASRTHDSGMVMNADGIAALVGAPIDSVGLLDFATTYRDADPLTESNFACIIDALAEADPEGEAYAIDRWRHPFVGWVEYVFVDTRHAAVSAATDDLAARLSAYPCLDEEDYSAREWEANHPGDGECYAEDEDGCPCRDDDGEAAA